MDIQLKRGLLDLCVLRVLDNKDSYGYQIIKDVSIYVDISESTLYPILKRLENGSLVTSYTEEFNSRLRKYYKITNSGKEKLKEFINDYDKLDKIYNFIKGGKNE